MKLSCRLEVLPGSTVLEQVTQARDYGFDGIGLPGRFLTTYREEVEQVLDDLPLPLMSLSLGFESSLLHPEASERRRCLESLCGLMDVCARWGVKKLNVPPVLLQDNPVRITDPNPYSSLVERLDALLLDELEAVVDEAEARDLVFLLEPVNRFESEYLHSVEHAARLSARIGRPGLGVTIDTYHMQLEELKPSEAIARAGKEIRHVHVAENTRVEPGVGSLDFASVFGALRSIGYDDWIEVECRSLSGRPEEVLPCSVNFLRAQWQRAIGG